MRFVLLLILAFLTGACSDSRDSALVDQRGISHDGRRTLIGENWVFTYHSGPLERAIVGLGVDLVNHDDFHLLVDLDHPESHGTPPPPGTTLVKVPMAGNERVRVVCSAGFVDCNILLSDPIDAEQLIAAALQAPEVIELLSSH